MYELNESVEVKSLTDRLIPDNDLKKFCRAHKKIYIYSYLGAQKTISLLSVLNDIGEKADGIILKNARQDATIFGGYQPYSLADIELDASDGVIISTSKDEMATVLELEIKTKNFDVDTYIAVTPEMALPDTYSDYEKTGAFFEDFYELDDLGKKYGTEKSSYYYDYLKKYEFFFSRFREEEIRVMELGVFEGASIRTFDGVNGDGYFTNATIIGIDMLEGCKKHMPNPNQFFLTNLSYEKNLTDLKKIEPTIIIDDASHIWSHQIKALFILWDALPSGGLYIMEGIETSFLNAGFKGYDDAVISAFEICRDIAELTAGRTFIDDESNHPFAEECKDIAKEVDMISFIKGSCIMVKK